jgi:hypothetical protein
MYHKDEFQQFQFVLPKVRGMRKTSSRTSHHSYFTRFENKSQRSLLLFADRARVHIIFVSRVHASEHVQVHNLCPNIFAFRYTYIKRGVHVRRQLCGPHGADKPINKLGLRVVAPPRWGCRRGGQPEAERQRANSTLAALHPLGV